MPKNNNKTILRSWCYYFECSCGLEKTYNDEKTMTSARERHYKYCAEYKKNSKEMRYENDRYKFNNSTGKLERTDTEAEDFFIAMRLANQNAHIIETQKIDSKKETLAEK
jgi:hypothetical protein